MGDDYDDWSSRPGFLTAGYTIIVILVVFGFCAGLSAAVQYFASPPPSPAVIDWCGAVYFGLTLLVGGLATAGFSLVLAATSNPLIGAIFHEVGAEWRSRYKELNRGFLIALVAVSLATIFSFAQFSAHVSSQVGGFSLTQPDFWRWTIYGGYLYLDSISFGAIHTFVRAPPVVPIAGWAIGLTYLVSAFLQLSAFSVLVSVTSPFIRWILSYVLDIARGIFSGADQAFQDAVVGVLTRFLVAFLRGTDVNVEEVFQEATAQLEQSTTQGRGDGEAGNESS